MPKLQKQAEALSAEKLANFPLFAGLDRATLEGLAAVGELHLHRSGAYVLRQGTRAQHLYALLDGVVRVIISDSRGVAVVAKVFSGPAVFGEMEALTDTDFIEDVVVERASRIVAFPISRLRPLFLEHPEVCARLLHDVCLRFRTSAQNQAFAAFESAERRLAALLLSYGRSLGVKVEDGVQIVSAAITQEALADSVGVNRKSVQRCFVGWTEARLVERRGRALLILDPRGLEAIAGERAPRFDHSLGKR